MKLATYKDGSRDGQLIVVSRDLSTAHYATGIAAHLQQVLDDWNFLAPQLEDLYATLNQGKARHAFAFDPQLCMAPLPRAYELSVAASAEGAEAAFQISQVSGGDLAAPHEALRLDEAGEGVGITAGVAAITGDVARGVAPEQAQDGVRLLMLAGLRNDATAFSPVTVTPDELGEAWQESRVQLPVQISRNGRSAKNTMALPFGRLIASLAQARRVRAGCIVVEALQENPPVGAVNSGNIRIELKGADGQSVFGAIVQKVAAATSTAAESEAAPEAAPEAGTAPAEAD